MSKNLRTFLTLKINNSTKIRHFDRVLVGFQKNLSMILGLNFKSLTLEAKQKAENEISHWQFYLVCGHLLGFAALQLLCTVL